MARARKSFKHATLMPAIQSPIKNWDFGKFYNKRSWGFILARNASKSLTLMLLVSNVRLNISVLFHKAESFFS